MADTPNETPNETPDSGVSEKAQARIRSLSARVAELETWKKDNEPKLTGYDAIHGQMAELRTAHERERASWQTERAIVGAGIHDDEGVDFVRNAYERLPPKDRPTLGDWLRDVDKLPRGVRAYLPERSTPEAPQAAPEAPQAPSSGRPPAPAPPPQPSPNRGVQPVQPLASPYDASAISRMTPAEYAQHRAAIWGQTGNTPPKS